jgi:hypothetical protein
MQHTGAFERQWYSRQMFGGDFRWGIRNGGHMKNPAAILANALLS